MPTSRSSPVPIRDSSSTISVWQAQERIKLPLSILQLSETTNLCAVPGDLIALATSRYSSNKHTSHRKAECSTGCHNATSKTSVLPDRREHFGREFGSAARTGAVTPSSAMPITRDTRSSTHSEDVLFLDSLYPLLQRFVVCFCLVHRIWALLSGGSDKGEQRAVDKNLCVYKDCTMNNAYCLHCK